MKSKINDKSNHYSKIDIYTDMIIAERKRQAKETIFQERQKQFRERKEKI